MAWVNTSPLVKTFTLEEFWKLPEPPDRSKVELIAGVLYITPEVSRTAEVRYRGQEKFGINGILKPGDQLVSRVLPGFSLCRQGFQPVKYYGAKFHSH